MWWCRRVLLWELLGSRYWSVVAVVGLLFFCGKWAWRVIMRGLAWGSSAGMGMLGGVAGSVVYG